MVRHKIGKLINRKGLVPVARICLREQLAKSTGFYFREDSDNFETAFAGLISLIFVSKLIGVKQHTSVFK
jgi:hypothetical protein